MMDVYATVSARFPLHKLRTYPEVDLALLEVLDIYRVDVGHGVWSIEDTQAEWIRGEAMRTQA